VDNKLSFSPLRVFLGASVVSTSSHIDADCFICVFLSHGEGNHVYAYDAKIEIQTLTGLFKGDKCQSLVGKPKIFIIQVRLISAIKLCVLVKKVKKSIPKIISSNN
jgi:hypothetical protein